MTARWMQAKKLKQARERRAWARPFSIKNSAGPNWHNGTQARETPSNPDAFLAEERRLAEEKSMRVGRVPDISEIRKEIPDPFFNTIVDTPYHRCRVYWNSQRNTFILQYVQWFSRQVKISIAYPTFTRANFVFQTDKVRWKKTINF